MLLWRIAEQKLGPGNSVIGLRTQKNFPSRPALHSTFNFVDRTPHRNSFCRFSLFPCDRHHLCRIPCRLVTVALPDRPVTERVPEPPPPLTSYISAVDARRLSDSERVRFCRYYS